MVIPLRELDLDAAPLFIKDLIARFTCLDNDVESFLKNKAFDFERRNKSRTYLIYEGNLLIGYFTLSLTALPFQGHISKNTVKDIDGFSKNVQAVGIILIGQFGKDKVLAKNIAGKSLFDICLDTVYRAQQIVGSRFVMLECQSIPKVVSFYTDNDFSFLQYDKNDKYMQMIRRL
jgi:hypothetical protein